MKKILHLAIISILALSVCSCDKWLDVNVNPSSPTNVTASCATRLPWIQHAYGYAYGSASVTISTMIGHLASNSSYAAYCDWVPGDGAGPITPYQQWFVDGASNLQDLVNKATEEEAWHYVGAAYVLEAMGFVLMVDLYGEIPYTEALTNTLSPKYDDGKTIYEKCLAKLDDALAMFAKDQAPTAEALSAGDNWNGGDVQKWIKLCHGLKARWLNNMSKSSQYNPTAILNEIALGPQSNAENTVIRHTNDVNDVTGDPLVGDPLKTSFVYDVAAWGTWARTNQWYMNLLTNDYTGGSGEKDPRLDKLVPSCERWADLNGDGIKEKYWDRTQGVDLINSDIRVEYPSAPYNPVFDTKTKKWSIAADIPERFSDTSYVLLRGISAMQAGAEGNGIRIESDGTVTSSGTFYSWPDSPTDVLTYHEMCFIKAEVLLRQGDKGGASSAYKEGIRAHMTYMNTILTSYGTDAVNPVRDPMNQVQVDNFLNNSQVMNGPISMSKIMMQKYIAMSFTVQNWNDMRRFNYSAGNVGDFGVVYVDFDRPMTFKMSATASKYFPGTSKTDDNYWFRRFRQTSMEIRYNKENMVAFNPKALDSDLWSLPVWWDKAE